MACRGPVPRSADSPGGFTCTTARCVFLLSSGLSPGPAAPPYRARCGPGPRPVHDKPPSRAVTIHQHPAELMLALGLKDRMVGTAFPDSAVLPRYEKDFASIPERAAKEPSFENVLEAEPDFVYGGCGSAFAKNAGRSREAFADAGIDTYLNREYCGMKRVSMRDTYDEIRAIGTIFGVSERADRLVADLQGRIGRTTEAVKDAPPVPVFVYDSGDKAAFTAGGKSLGTEIIRLARGRNVFADLNEVFGDASWEQVVARKPEVIALYDYRGAGSVAEKKKFLLSQPALADVPAIKNKRFVVLPLTATLVGVRPPYAVEDLARRLHPERFR
ncbi:ABC transporter substrate-binding protein [Streptomyces sp. NPDC059850]|uniref:ABC transporter substrate-binding protein n=1 Tax=Streptomyces sp. NPDC059850 TaxID=3346970 RepID=UPI00365C7A19